MTRYLFTVVRLENHDYANRLDELFSLEMGTEMKIHLEPDNEMEADAVMVIYGSDLVGYIRSGEQRYQAAKLLRQMEHPLTCRVVEANSEYKRLSIAVSTDIKLKGCDYAVLDELEGMHYNGELLRQEPTITKLRAILEGLADEVDNEHKWDNAMEKEMNFIADNLWRDSTKETQTQAMYIEKLLKASSANVDGYAEAASRMEYVITSASSSDSRNRQATFLTDRACSEEVRRLISSMGKEKAMEEAAKIPPSLTCIYDHSPQEFAGKVWYMRLSSDKLRQLETLMAIRIALNHKDMEADEVLVGGDKTLELLRNVMCVYNSPLPKDLSLIYCALRDNDLLVNRYNYLKFVELLVTKRLLPAMNETRKTNLATGIGQHLRTRRDHGKVKKGFADDYRVWPDGADKETCSEIARMLTTGK